METSETPYIGAGGSTYFRTLPKSRIPKVAPIPVPQSVAQTLSNVPTNASQRSVAVNQDVPNSTTNAAVGTPTNLLNSGYKAAGINYEGLFDNGQGGLATAVTGGLGNYGTYNGVGIDQDAYNAIKGSGVTDGLSKSDGFFGGLGETLANKDLMSGISGGMSALTTGYDLYDKIWGGASKARDAQIENARAQADYNRSATQHKKDFYAGAKSAFAPGA